jgi:septal ring factor EnvC (AmiA/AmiB activator)
VQCASREEERESPLLLAPLIQNKMLFSHIPLSTADRTEAKEEPNIPRWFMVEANKELQRVKQQLADDQQRIAYRDKRIKELEKEIVRLKRKIKAFETIDQKIQKKKNAIPSAD